METRLPEELFRFSWYVDQHGYKLEFQEDEPGKTSLTAKIPGWRLARKGGPLREYWPLDEHPGLFRRFANLPEDLSPEDLSPEPKALLEFANEFGLLGTWAISTGQMPDSEDLIGWRDDIRSFRAMVGAIDDGRVREACEAFRGNTGPRMTVRIEHAPFGGRYPSLHVAPLTLVGALWLQVAGQLTQGLKFRKCKHKQCPTHFPVGARTRFRKTKVFCSDRCRVAWNRQKKKELVDER